jgi:hypothetical protein
MQRLVYRESEDRSPLRVLLRSDGLPSFSFAGISLDLTFALLLVSCVSFLPRRASYEA